MPTATNADDYALVVGIDDYPEYRPLKGAVKDARDFASWLCVEPNGGGLSSANCKTIYSATNPVSPLQDRIDEKLEEVFSSIPKGKQARRLYMYFSGHGMAETNLITDLCLANWAEKFPNRALNAQRYQEALMKLGKFEQIIIFLDCCRVRLVAIKGHAPDFVVPTPGQGAPQVRFFLANATEFLAPSYEAATQDKDGDAPIVRGYFTRALMAALRGEAAVAPGGVPASRLKNYLEERVPVLAQKDGYSQDPEVVNGLRGDPVFGCAPPSPPSAESTPGVPPGPGGGGSSTPTQEPRGPAARVSLTLYDSLGAKSLAVLDEWNKAVFRGPVRTKKKLRLPAGFYNLLTTFDKSTVLTPLELDKETHIFTHDQLHAVPEYYTAAPLENAPTSHGYYTFPSEQWSKQPTRSPLPGTADSSLFIFLRAVDREKRGVDSNLASQLLLVDSQGKEVSHLSDSDVKQDAQTGWLAFHVAAPHGTLYLRFSGDPARELPLHLYPSWQTQAFLMYRDKLLFETLKVFLARAGRGFEPRAVETRAADLALNGLQSGRDLLPESALQLLLHGKFENPIFGLVGAHVLIQRLRALQNRLSLERRGPSAAGTKQRQEDERRIRVVLDRLSYLLPASPDVAALRVAAAFLQQAEKFKFEFHHPPMLRLGLRAVLLEAAKMPSLLAKDSLIPKIAARLYADTPWTMWRPETKDRGIDWVHLAILDIFKKKDASGRRSRRTEPASPKLMAEQIGLPQQTIVQSAEYLRKTPAAKLRRELPPEYRPLIRKAKLELSGPMWRAAAQMPSQTAKITLAKQLSLRKRTRAIAARNRRRALIAALRTKVVNARKNRVARRRRIAKRKQGRRRG